jgi:hypothetical protein
VNVSELSLLETLDIQKCKLQSLDVTKNLRLTSLVCSENELTSLDVSNNTSLIKFYCNKNKLPRIIVTANTALQEFDISDNLISALNIRSNTALTYLNVSNNTEVTMVDVQYNTLLQKLCCDGLAIGDINLSNNTQLSYFTFTNNTQLTSICVSDNFTMDNCLFTSVVNNPNLSIFNTTGKVFYYIGQYSTTFGSRGIVYEITNGGQNGKMISTKETYKNWSEAKTWCSNYGSGWYLPSLEELKTIYNNKSSINSTLSANDFTTLDSGNYWSSSESYYDNACILIFSNGEWANHLNKKNSYYVRAVLAF